VLPNLFSILNENAAIGSNCNRDEWDVTSK